MRALFLRSPLLLRLSQMVTTSPCWRCSPGLGDLIFVQQYFWKQTKSNFSDIAVSVSESAVLAREFLVSFLAEFYLQLTTISWLSVRTVQRTNKSLSPSDEDNRAGSLLSSILSVFSSLLELFSSTGPAYQADSDWSSAPEPSVVITRAEERVRWADTRHM